MTIFSVIRLFLVFFFLSCPQVGLASDRTYLIVVDNVCQDKNNWVDDYKPSYYAKVFYWTELDAVLEKAAKRAEDRPIVLDMGCHGIRDGYLCLSGPNDEGATLASVGYFLNRVEDKLRGKNLKCITLDACFSRICFEKSYTVKREYQNLTCYIESYHGTYPAYPIYGIGKSSSYNNLVFMQYIKNRRIFFEDLRNYIGHPVEEPIRDNHTLMMLSLLLTILQSKG